LLSISRKNTATIECNKNVSIKAQSELNYVIVNIYQMRLQNKIVLNG